MQAEELLQTRTDDELKRRANHCFLQAEDTSLYRRPSPEERLRFLTEADFYLKALIWRQDARTAERDRKRDEQIARRDFWMEVAVIVLIGVEIVLSAIGLRDGSKQGQVLAHMDASTADTAATMQTVRDELKSLAVDQAKTREILQNQESYRLAQLAKKPRLELFVGHVPLLKRHATFTPTQETDSIVTYHLDLWNRGDITANRLYLRALVSSKDVTAYSNSGGLVPEPDPTDPSIQSFILPQVFLRSHSYFPVDINFAYQKGHAPFQVTFKTDSEESRTPTLLGVLPVNPRTPSK